MAGNRILFRTINTMIINSKSKFAEDFIAQYNKVGFGSMNKNDFEVLIFHLLCEHGDLKEKSVYDISAALQIPETKVRRLAYEATLKYSNRDESYVRDKIFQLLQNAYLIADGKKIQFAVEDKFIKMSINAKLKKLGHFADSSFNSEVASINIDAFIDLLEDLYSPDEREALISNARYLCSSEVEDITFKSIIKKLFEGAIAHTGTLASCAFWSPLLGKNVSHIIELIST